MIFERAAAPFVLVFLMLSNSDFRSHSNFYSLLNDHYGAYIEYFLIHGRILDLMIVFRFVQLVLILAFGNQIFNLL